MSDGTDLCVSAKGHRGRHAYRSLTEFSIALNEARKTAAVEDDVAKASFGEFAPESPEPPRDDAADEKSDAEWDAANPEILKAQTKDWTPESGDFISLRGKLYLPARRRIQWMRGEVTAHPDWTIDTMTEEFERGKYIRPGRVEGGFAVVRASVFDSTGRLIATGVKTEYSENFADFLEKAETGAIARALAVAGYGTESALDLDEGAEDGRVADSPVDPTTGSIGSKPTLGPSNVPGVGRGGHTESATAPQIRRVSELSRTLGLGPLGLGSVIESLFGVKLPDLPDNDADASRIIATFLSEQAGSKVGELIASLEAALPAKVEVK